MTTGAVSQGGFDQDISGLIAPNPQGQLPQEFIQAMQGMFQDEQAGKADADVLARRSELHAYLKRWLGASMQYRRANHENKWNRYRRNARSIYDPQKLAGKEGWQSRMFVPITMQNKEIIKAAMHRTVVSGLPVEVKARQSGDEEQAYAIRDLVKREMERSELEIHADPFLDEIMTYGTGFMKYVWEDKTEMRGVRSPVLAPYHPALAMMGQPPQVVGYQKVQQPRQVYRGMKAYWVSIWDMFFPHNINNSAKFKEMPKAQRVRVPYQDILNGVQQGYYFPEAATILKDVWEDGKVDVDRQEQTADLYHSQLIVPKTQNEKQHTLYEWWGMLPQKWVYVHDDDQHMVTDPDALVPAKVLFNADALCSVDENDRYDGQDVFEYENYIKVGGDIYGIGVAEMLEQIQDDINETTNQRRDNVQLILNRMCIILDRAIVSRADLVSKPGGAIRIKGDRVEDVNKAFAWIDTPDVTKSSYVETENDERFAQELTGATRVTMGSGGEDVTKTASGLNLLKSISNERLAYYAMLIEAGWMRRTIRAYYVEIYNNIRPDEVMRILGPERAMFFQLLPPEEVDQDYKWSPEGVFSNMHQPERFAQWAQLFGMLMQAPWFNGIEGAEILLRAADVPDRDKLIITPTLPNGMPMPTEMLYQLQQQQMMMGPTNGPRPPGKPNGHPPPHPQGPQGSGPSGIPGLGGQIGAPNTMPPPPGRPQ